jgi:hypothetical protein
MYLEPRNAVNAARGASVARASLQPSTLDWLANRWGRPAIRAATVPLLHCVASPCRGVTGTSGPPGLLMRAGSPLRDGGVDHRRTYNNLAAQQSLDGARIC